MFLVGVVWEEGGEAGAKGEGSLMFQNKTWLYRTEVWICPVHEEKTWAPSASADRFWMKQPALWSAGKRSLEAWLLRYQHHC